MRIKYNLVRKNNFKRYLEISINKSYEINKRIDKESIGLINFYDDDLINKVIKKKIDARFKIILELMIKIDEDDSDPSEGYMSCLNELDKLKKELINKYRKYLEKKNLLFLEKKIAFLENEIKVKLFNIRIINNPIIMDNNSYEDEIEKESTRRR